MKISELEKDEKSKIENDIEAAAGSMGLGDLWGIPGNSERKDTRLYEMIGICSSCKRLNYCRGEYGTVYARCEEYEIKLTGRERIKECTSYVKRGEMLLNEAMTMAYIIELDGRKIGF